MFPPPFPDKRFMQLCWVVPDIQAAMASWTRSAGVGPFFFFENVTFENGRYRGRPAQMAQHQAAIAQAGDLQIELVCQDNEDRGVFRDTHRRGEFGLHHMALICDDYEAERDAYLEAGAELAFEGRTGTSRTAWVDTSPTLGFMVELLEPSATREAAFAGMRQAADTWDGTTRVIGGP